MFICDLASAYLYVLYMYIFYLFFHYYFVSISVVNMRVKDKEMTMSGLPTHPWYMWSAHLY